MIDGHPKLFISVSSKPGSLGARVYRRIFESQKINALYVPRFAPAIAAALVSAIRSLQIQGCSVSMPLKQLVMSEIDKIAECGERAMSVNTIVNRSGELTGYSTDYLGAHEIFARLKVESMLIFGAGGVVGAMVAAAKQARVKKIVLCARRNEAAIALAQRLDVESLDIAGNRECAGKFDIFINATPLGWSDGNISTIEPLIDQAGMVFDLVPSAEPTAVIRACQQLGKSYLTGLDLFKAQVRHQCYLYTGYLPEEAEIEAALVE